MGLNSWDHHDLGKEIAKAKNVGELLTLYKREKDIYLKGCQELVSSLSSYTQDGRDKKEKELELQDERCMKIAIAIADNLI